MSSIGGGTPIDTSILQAAQAQQVASKVRDRDKAATDAARRRQDLVDLKVAGVEAADALRKLPQNESEQAEDEQRRHPPPEDQPRIDVQA